MSMPKWFRKEMLPFYDAQPGVDWGTAGLIEEALQTENGTEVQVINYSGSVKSDEDGRRVIKELVELTGLRVINRDLSWHRDENETLTSRVWAVDDRSLIAVTFDAYQEMVQCYVMTTEASILPKIEEYFKANTFREKPEEYIYAMVQKQGRIQFQRIGKAYHELERENYSAEVNKLYDRVVHELNAETPRGRIAIFDGPPGTGKTYMIRAILNDAEGIHVMVPSHMVSSLADPSILPAIIELKQSQEDQIIFIIEDGDEVIAPRGADNMPAISSVLNLGDGILGACLDIRVLITTNAKRQEMDEAMTRPGRLISIVHVGKLSPDEAQVVYNKATNGKGTDIITEPMTLAEVYSKALDSGFQPVAKKAGKVGFGS